MSIVLKLFNVYFLCSAAKAPYLARFKVKKCGINDLESMALAVSSGESEGADRPSIGLELWQAAIFKACLFIILLS